MAILQNYYNKVKIMQIIINEVIVVGRHVKLYKKS